MNTISFEDYCDDILNLSIGLMSKKQLNEARAGYAEHIKDANKNTYKNVDKLKREKALAKAKEARKLAKFYGGKALKGSAKQKKWAEEIRQNVLESSSLTEEQKESLVKLEGIVASAKFWIDNRDKSPAEFDSELIISEYSKVCSAYQKHREILMGSNFVNELEIARKEIYETLCSIKFKMMIEMPKCSDFYDNYGSLKLGLKFRC